MAGEINRWLQAWSDSDLEELERGLLEGDSDVEAFFGPQEAAEMRSLVTEATAPTRSATGPRPAVVILPGIMGSLLQSIQGLIDLLWINPVAILRGRVSLLEMDPSGERNADPRVHVAPTSLEMIYYTKIVLGLRKHVDLYQFPFDWRLDIRVLARHLAEALERWAAGTDRKFVLVGHSMGGLVSRAFLAMFPEQAERRVQQLIMLGTPNHGAPEAVRNLIEGNDMTELADRLNGENRATQLIRRIPSAYQLLPAPPEMWPSELPYPTNFDLYDPTAWPIDDLNPRFLEGGRAFWELLAASDPQVPHVLIAGCNLETTIGVRVMDRGDGFDLLVDRGRIGLTGGDGTVPLVSALMPGVETYFIQHPHAKLPSHRRVIQAVRDLALGQKPDLPQELPAPSRSVQAPAPPLDIEAEAEALRARIVAGQVSAADLEKLHFLLG
ncbi:MAG: hypothetical protein Kow0047_02820 [Anaerolineae bacterium]